MISDSGSRIRIRIRFKVQGKEEYKTLRGMNRLVEDAVGEAEMVVEME